MDTANPFPPLTEAELDELEHFLTHEAGSDDAMMLSMLDGFLHAIIVGPTTIPMNQWLPKIWGVDTLGHIVLSEESFKAVNHIFDLLLRHYNSIIVGLEAEQQEINAIWTLRAYRGKTYNEGEVWAYGFIEGMQLCWDDWQSMLDTKEGMAWFRPIGLLGMDEFSSDQDELTKTPLRRAKLTEQMPLSVIEMYWYWLPYRDAINERTVAKIMQPDVGRNALCPCGSGKKFKRCCGTGGELH